MLGRLPATMRRYMCEEIEEKLPIEAYYEIK